jgi:succinyl-diaminopimelate desuccinylase
VVETLRERGQKIDWCIVGEPSSEKELGDTIKIGRRGSLSGRLTGARRARDTSPIRSSREPGAHVAPALAELTARVWDKGNEHFQPTSFQISNFNAGTGAPNVIPGELNGAIQPALLTVQTIDGLKTIVEDILKKHGVRYTLEWYISGEPFYTATGRPVGSVTRAIRSRDGHPPEFSTGGRHLRWPVHRPARRAGRRAWRDQRPPSTRSTRAST